MQNSYPIGQAPWESQNTGASPAQNYPIGQAPWESGSQSPSQPNALQQVGSAVLNTVAGVGKNLAAGPLAMVARPGQLLGVGIGGLASKLTGNPSFYQNFLNAVNQPSNFAGVPLKPINQETPESIAGEGASTVSLGGIPGASIPVSGAIQGALAGAGNAMQSNASPLGVTGQAATGGLLGYGAGALTQGLISKFQGPPSLDDILWKSGAVSDQPTSDSIQSTLSDNGITSLQDKDDISFSKNVLSNSLRDAQSDLRNVTSVDAISGEPTDESLKASARISSLQNALRAITQVGQHMNASHVASRLGILGLGGAFGLGNLGSNAVQNAGNFLYNKFVAQGQPNPITSSVTQ